LTHPFPSAVNALATAGLATLAAAPAPVALRLGLSMLALQASIGVVNDLFDEPFDRVNRPGKPLVAGRVSRRAAALVAGAALGAGIALSAASGAATALVAAAGVGLGYAYDAGLSRTLISWLPLAVALPLVPVHAWLGATGTVPDPLLALVPIAVVAGAGLTVGNGLADLDADAGSGRPSLAARLGRSGAWLLATALLAAAALGAVATAAGWHVGSWESGEGTVRLAGLVGGCTLLPVGAGLLWARSGRVRQVGWGLQAIGVALIGIGWIAGAAVGSGG